MSKRHCSHPAATFHAARSLPAPPGHAAVPRAGPSGPGRAALRRLGAGALVVAGALVAGASVGLAASPGAPAPVSAIPPAVPALLAARPGGVGAAPPAEAPGPAPARRPLRSPDSKAVPLPHQAPAAAGRPAAVDSARVGVDLLPRLRLAGPGVWPGGWPGDGPVLGLIRLRLLLPATKARAGGRIGSNPPPNPRQFGQSGRNR